MINPSNSSLVENFNLMGKALRRKRKFSEMMNTSVGITHRILNNNLHYKNTSLNKISESLFLKSDYCNENFETKKRKIKNIPSANVDFVYRIEKDFGELKIQKVESAKNNINLDFNENDNCEFNSDLQLLYENTLDNNCLLNCVKRNGNSNSLLGKKSKYEENPNNETRSKYPKKDNLIINCNSNLNQINSLNSFDYLIEDEEIIDTTTNNNNSNCKAFKKEKNNNNVIDNKENHKLKKELKTNLNKTKIIEDSFNENIIDIDMSDFKNQPNNQNFFNSELTDLDTINTSRNSNFEDLSLSFLTEYTNKNVSENIISNAIETEKLMMKLFDICNPALQPTEK